MTVWETMIGQPQAIEVLRRAAEEGRDIVEGKPTPRQALSHAWLITGPPGSGRSIAARALAAALQCTGEPIGCGVCKGCRTTMAGSNADVQVHATDRVEIRREEALHILADAYSFPSNGCWRITIIEDADRMNDSAANTLLKSLEEPPARGIWVLSAPTPGEVLPTIRSRCRALGLRTPSVDSVAQYLAKTEDVSLEAAIDAAAIAQAHVGFARAILRTPALRSDFRDVFSLPLRAQGVGHAVLLASRMHDALVEIGKRQSDRANEKERRDLLLALGLEEGQRVPPALRAQVKALEEDTKRRTRRALADAIDRALTDLLSFYRDVLTIQLKADARLVNVDMADQVREVAQTSTPEATMARVEAVELARTRNRTNAAPLLFLESMAITLFDPQLGVENSTPTPSRERQVGVGR